MAKAELIQQADDRPYLTLTLTRAEAQALVNVTGHVAGTLRHEYGDTEPVFHALQRVGIHANTKLKTIAAL